ncbi:MAG: hypothetical protein IT453_12230 [Planctomycetes bacterium]|nr:hypothetical protein [Planctomycetota bacterium]
MISVGVVGLAWRRALAPSVLLAFALVALATTWIDWSGATGLPRGDAQVLRGLERRGLWLALLAMLGVATLARAAGQFARWRARELDWLAALPVRRSRWLVSTWCGDALALGVLVVLAAGFVELSVGASAPTTRTLKRVELPPLALVAERSQLEWTLHDVPSAAHARLELALAGGGRAAEVRWRARRGELSTATVGTIGLRTTLELALPPGDGPVGFDLERLAPGAIVVADPAGLALTEPVESDRGASWAIAARVWPALIAADALALGFAAWLSGASAGFATLALWLGAWLATRTEPLIPCSDLFDALAQVAAGLVPRAPEFAHWVGTAALVVLGLGLGSARPWSRQP